MCEPCLIGFSLDRMCKLTGMFSSSAVCHSGSSSSVPYRSGSSASMVISAPDRPS